MKPAVIQALQELDEGAPGGPVESKDDGSGGAFVLVRDLDIGEAYVPPFTWVAFHLPWSYPEGDVYPHFIDNAIKYVGDRSAPNEHPDGNLPTSMAHGNTAPGFELSAIQVSRRSQRWNPETDTALHKLLRVLDFIRSR
jgi:hypothetical protein